MLLAGLVLGVGSAGGRSLASTWVTVEVLGKGKVTSQPDGIKCGDGKTACSATFSGSVTLTATDSSNNWTFAKWKGPQDTDCVNSTSRDCTVTASGERQVTAMFNGPGTSPKTLTVTTTGRGNVHGTGINCGNDSSATQCSTDPVPEGSTLTVREAPDASHSFVFDGWGGDCSGTNVFCTVQTDGDRQVSARWDSSSATSQLTVSIAGGGEVHGSGIDCPPTCTATEQLNSTATLTAVPQSGYVFTTWSSPCGTAPTCAIAMDDVAGKDVTATFGIAEQLSVGVTGSGNVSGGTGAINCGNGGTACSSNFAQNSTVTLTATPATGANFLGWTDGCGGTGLTCTVLMNQAKSVNAKFSTVAGTG
ncbi:MAG TPA: hypothetical protein VKJ07_15310, partial [Mycobacteriales bacterium]|nr:hypothetical protein [Mycobacteriales bacterium]